MADLSEVFGEKALTYAEFQEAANGLYVSKEDHDNLQTSYSELQGKVTAFDTEKGNLTEQINTLKTEIKTRDEAAKQAAFETAVSGRFKAVTKDVKFANEITEKAIYGDFLSAVSDVKNAGKPDGEIYKSLIDGKDGLFRTVPPDGKGVSNKPIGDNKTLINALKGLKQGG
jgi:dynactin complex subunit